MDREASKRKRRKFRHLKSKLTNIKQRLIKLNQKRKIFRSKFLKTLSSYSLVWLSKSLLKVSPKLRKLGASSTSPS